MCLATQISPDGLLCTRYHRMKDRNILAVEELTVSWEHWNASILIPESQQLNSGHVHFSLEHLQGRVTLGESFNESYHKQVQ